jgi:excinuclease ABC subunit C
VPGQDDFASMEEVLRRRFARLGERAEAAAEVGLAQPVQPPAQPPASPGRSGRSGGGGRGRPGRFSYPPGLVVVDGGRGQLSVAERVLQDQGLPIPAIGLAKRLEEVYLPGQPQPLAIPRGSEALFLLQHIRDEAHRFAVTYHRTKRAKRSLHSPLDDIPGVGAVRKRALLKRFGSLARLRSASVEDLARTPGVGPVLASGIHDRLHGIEEPRRRLEAV